MPIPEEFKRVESSNIEAFGYDGEEESLYVKFLGRGNYPGSIYKYANVPPDMIDRLMDSPSKGKAFHKLIKDRYEYEKVE